MGRGKLSKIAWVLGVAAAAGAVGCVIQKDEEISSSPDRVVTEGDPSIALRSTVLIEGGCTAAKVGPRHLLLAARCVAGKETFEQGKTFRFASVSQGATALADTAEDAGARDAGAAPKRAGSNAREATIAEVHVHTSFESKCPQDACGLTRLGASDAADVAVLIVEEELDTVPTIAVDLDPVSAGDPLLVVGSGCEELDGTPAGKPATTRTIAVPARTVNHERSPYRDAPQLTTRLAASYVVTAGPAWQQDAPALCRGDLGGPVFRARAAAVAGINSNLTTWGGEGLEAVTNHHARVDEKSRYKIGQWLASLGVETMHSCSETAGGCVTRGYDGGVPEPPGGSQGDATESELPPSEDGGVTTDPIDPDGSAPDAAAPEETPTGPQEEELPPETSEDGYYSDEEGEDYGDAAVPRKRKKKKAQSGCSAAPGPVPAGYLTLALGLAATIAAVRRRRAR